ncbi:Abortive infection protein [Allomeiothermus silvanus DSM 9946]|uniref:Abortive infection protein n=1 Tax=Allomeiothermus silvanus (strain ATCC 700542 / DSM 9946 / NBRC 106475 / NCIMB 13440 / VI-R2) TaxID=526227 RepID=D7BFL5_ALLS1|nr:Abortive infection protein [Allomeiothermus silvanus DSM 9946]
MFARVICVLFAIQGGLFALGLLWMSLAGYPVLRSPDALRDTLAFFLLCGGLWGLEQVFSRLFPHSFRHAEALHRQLGLAMQQGGLTYPQALGLAGASGLGEEFFFRGALQNFLVGFLGPIGILVQAVIFAAFHPIPDRKAWAYPLYTLFAGLLFGLSYALTGSLIPGILAHYLHNARGFYELLDTKPAT